MSLKGAETRAVIVEGLYDFVGQETDELSFRKGDKIKVLDDRHNDWWKGELAGRIGLFPRNYVVSQLFSGL